MKKVLLIACLLPLTVGAQTTIFEENFDAYTAGNYAGNESPYMTSWSETPGGFDDCFISATQASSPSNSIEIVGQSGPMDALCQFPQSYDAVGKYRFSQKLYIPTGFAGYFNCQESTTPGLGWKCDVFFSIAGTGYLASNGDTSSIEFTYPKDAWFDVVVEADLTNDQGEIFIAGVSEGTFVWSVGVLGSEVFKRWGGVNYYAYGPNDEQANYFVDDLKLEDITDYTGISTNSNFDFSVYPNPSKGEVAIQWESNSTYDVIITDVMGKVVYSENNFASNSMINLDVNAGTYFVQLSDNENTTVKKMVIK